MPITITRVDETPIAPDGTDVRLLTDGGIERASNSNSGDITHGSLTRGEAEGELYIYALLCYVETGIVAYLIKFSSSGFFHIGGVRRG